MKDGLQNVSFDRILMRAKDIMSIISSILTIVTVVFSAMWMSFKFIESQNEQQKILNEVIARSSSPAR